MLRLNHRYLKSHCHNRFVHVVGFSSVPINLKKDKDICNLKKDKDICEGGIVICIDSTVYAGPTTSILISLLHGLFWYYPRASTSRNRCKGRGENCPCKKMKSPAYAASLRSKSGQRGKSKMSSH